jgi:hypothetical protein
MRAFGWVGQVDAIRADPRGRSVGCGTAGRDQPTEETPTLEQGDGGRAQAVGRGAIGRGTVPLQHEYPAAPAREQQRYRAPGDAAADHDHVVHTDKP